jgi:hypothetical protein
MQKSKNFLNYPLKIIFMFTLIGGVLFFLTPKGTDFDGPLRLAHQMLIGKFYLPESLSWMEHYDRDGHFYIAYPPMVSLVLTPFVFVLKDWVTQPGINTLLVFCSSILLYLFVRSLRALRPVAWVASVFFFF